MSQLPFTKSETLACLASILICIILPQEEVEAHPVADKSQNYSTSTFTAFYNNGARNINFPSSVDNQVLNKWTTSALKFFDFNRCVESQIASSEDECFRLNQIQRSEVAVYFATGQRLGNTAIQNGKRENFRKRSHKVVAVFPESSSPKSGGAHDAILVLDPYPNKNFGHLVAVFYIDFGVDPRKCKEDYQLFTTDGTCVTVARKSRCPNRLERYTSGGLKPRRCHIDFLPSVFFAERYTTTGSNLDAAGNLLAHDLLNCINLPGFAQCPNFRPLDDTRKVLCDASAENSKRCDTSHTGVGTRCKLFQTCDQAVLLGGGWNRIHSDMKSFENVIRMQESLSSIGFMPENIKTFYANGKIKNAHAGGSEKSMYDESSYFSSAMKTGLRGHLRTICETRHCADSLYIYLNNPTTLEGDMLLWDSDYNGMVDELEVYTVPEFLSDILGCEARRVVIIADQSNSDVLVSSLKESSEHKNVVLLTAGLLDQVTKNGELTSLWANHSDSSSCIKAVFQHVVNGMPASNPTFFDATSGIASKVSMIGAPCDLIPPVNARELKVLYEGCQNVPTSIWFSGTFEDTAAADYDSNTGMEESDENSPNARRT